jgi:protease FtsH subunit HflK
MQRLTQLFSRLKLIEKQRIAEANGQVERFNQMYEQYKLYPLITKKRLFYEKLESTLPGCKIIITDGSTETMIST